MAEIVWIASYPKSGNTWMRVFLNNLLSGGAAPAGLDGLARFTQGDTLKAWYARAAGRPVDGFSHQDLARLRPAVHRLIADAAPGRVFVKTHMALADAFGVPLITRAVTAAAIYIVRDPRDVAISAAEHFGASIDQTIALMADPSANTLEDDRHVPQYFGSWSANVESWTARPSPILHVVRYEDMLKKPKPTFLAAARFLGLKANVAEVERAIAFSSFDVLKKQEAETGFIERSKWSQSFFTRGGAGHWRTMLTPTQAAAIEAAHGATMRRFKYRIG